VLGIGGKNEQVGILRKFLSLNNAILMKYKVDFAAFGRITATRT